MDGLLLFIFDIGGVVCSFYIEHCRLYIDCWVDV